MENSLQLAISQMFGKHGSRLTNFICVMLIVVGIAGLTILAKE